MGSAFIIPKKFRKKSWKFEKYSGNPYLVGGAVLSRIFNVGGSLMFCMTL